MAFEPLKLDEMKNKFEPSFMEVKTDKEQTKLMTINLKPFI